MEAAEQRFVQQLKKGALEMLVLRLLADAPCHGYALLVRLRQAGGEMLELKEGTLYPILYRLEDDGCIASAWQGGGQPAPACSQAIARRTAPKKVYTVTPRGQALLAAEARAWEKFSACVVAILDRAAGPQTEQEERT